MKLLSLFVGFLSLFWSGNYVNFVGLLLKCEQNILSVRKPLKIVFSRRRRIFIFFQRNFWYSLRGLRLNVVKINWNGVRDNEKYMLRFRLFEVAIELPTIIKQKIAFLIEKLITLIVNLSDNNEKWKEDIVKWDNISSVAGSSCLGALTGPLNLAITIS